jgi:hypothetical protein
MLAKTRSEPEDFGVRTYAPGKRQARERAIE